MRTDLDREPVHRACARRCWRGLARTALSRICCAPAEVTAQDAAPSSRPARRADRRVALRYCLRRWRRGPASKAPGATTSEPGKPGKGTTPAKVKPGNVSPENLPESPKVANAKGARADVSLKGCPVRDGKATASGKVKNSTGATTDYAITISSGSTSAPMSCPRRRGCARPDLGQSVAWKVSAPARALGLTPAPCSLSAVRCDDSGRRGPTSVEPAGRDWPDLPS